MNNAIRSENTAAPSRSGIDVTISPNAPSTEFAAYMQGRRSCPEMPSYTARITRDHAASSYGLPVIVLADGNAYGPADLAKLYPISALVIVPNPAPEWRDPEMEGLIAAAAQAGYRIEREQW